MDWIQILQEIAASGIGTVAFALMFHVPKSCYPLAGVAGGAGWLIYRLVQNGTDSSVLAAFFGALAVVILSRISAVFRKCPVTMFLIPGIFPLVPGMGLYQTAYSIVEENWAAAGETGLAAVQFAGAIVGGILLGFELPQKWFRRKR